MSPEFAVLAGTAVTLGVTHTAIGVDHTLPFIFLGKARNWSLNKTLLVTAACAAGHVLSSVAIGALGYYGLGVALPRLVAIEVTRGEWAAWLLIAFGVAYASIGWWRLRKAEPHAHVHVHEDGTMHVHRHHHGSADGGLVHHHAHRERAAVSSTRRLVPALFVVFVLGPCEALIPLMVAPALTAEGGGPLIIATVFGLATMLTMLGLVALGYLGLNLRRLDRLEPHMQWLAGVAIALSGLSVKLLGV